jgi:O-succinylhomoserine sulfhydrylase
LCSLPNLGDTRTIVTHPAQQRIVRYLLKNVWLSITDGLVRVSVGLETVTDVIADLEQALS